MRYLKLPFLTLLAVCLFSSPVAALSGPCYVRHYYGPQNGSADPTPCETDLLAWYADTWADDATLEDKAATGTHAAMPPVSVYLGGGSYGTLDSTITLVGDAEIGFSGTVPDTSSDQRAVFTNTTGSNYFRFDSVSQAIFRDTVRSIEFDLSTLGITIGDVFDGVLKKVGTTVTFTYNGTIITGHVAAAAVDITIDIIGKRGASNDRYLGHLYDFYIKDSTGTTVLSNFLASGASSTVSPSAFPLAGANDITFSGLTVPDDWTDDPRFGHSYNRDSYVIADGTGTYASGSYLPASYTSEGTLYTGTALQNLDVDGWMADLDGSEELTLAHLAGTESVTTSTGTSTVSVAAGNLTFTAGTVGYVLLDDGTELIFQSFYDSEQITVYDVRATGTQHHGTFTGATVGVGGQWSAEIDESWLAQWGGSVDGVNIIPGKEDSTEDAVSNTKTFTRPYSDSPEGAFVWNAPLTAEVWAADNDNQLINATTGAAEDFDPYDFVEPDPATFLMGPDGAVLLEDEQTGDCLTETTDYLGL